MNFEGKVYMVGNSSMAAEMDALGIKHVGIGVSFISAYFLQTLFKGHLLRNKL